MKASQRGLEKLGREGVLTSEHPAVLVDPLEPVGLGDDGEFARTGDSLSAWTEAVEVDCRS